ncbi:MAG: bifunctional phosphopantothenoylcysteine decarboxylase/phosphopantothenate synthase [Sphingomonadales bacterium]|nr:bifunctional phosphopantothenoylcysteine decarboxylase/phosphopantothenate synthase [Sphingomonadales bacterium]MBD3775050.1 bifunctional phosphopantothenoylcysteine decarboxylase/phosphopantothenate synthase [Paracoccaceae bacterium]
MTHARILLVVGGGIAAYKACELVRLIRRGGGSVTCVLTEGGSHFVTPMALAALSENPVHTTLWDLKNEVEMGHIQLSREADLVVVCPATANMLAKMAAGIADDLATTLILATDKPVMAVPAMNVRMWQHEATQRNVGWLREAGVTVLEPDEGPMACGEFGPGRLPEPWNVWCEIAGFFGIDPAVAGIPAELPVAPPREAAAAASPAAGSLVEAIEAEPEVQPKSGGGFGGLLSSLIGRSTPRRPVVEVEDDWGEEPLEGEAPVEGEGWPDEAAPEVLPEPLPVPDLSGPLMAVKGKAKAAPPTDAQAINHEVNPNQVPPEQAQPNAAPSIGAVLEDPLEGQPDFDVDPEHRPLFGRHVLVTAGPTHEPIDPVRYIANRSSGKQGFAIAAAAAALGARVTLVAGPVHLATPLGVDRIDVESAEEMNAAVKKALPVDAAVMVAAVADWRTRDYAGEKMKKRGSAPPALILAENPDILANLAAMAKRPKLLVGFAAETNDVLDNAKAKRKRKGADWIVANDVSGGKGKSVMGGDRNAVQIVTGEGVEKLPEMPKEEVAMALAERIAQALDERDKTGE